MVLEDEDLHRLGNAFDRAWDRFLRTGMLSAVNLQPSQEILARRILDHARAGERDEWRLARDAFMHLWQVQFPDLATVPVAGPANRRGSKRRGRMG